MANLGSGFFGGEGGGGFRQYHQRCRFLGILGGGITRDTHGLRGIMGDFNYLG